MQLAASERGLQHVASIYRAFCLAGPDHGMQLIDEHDGAAFVGGDVLQYRFQPLFELAAILGTREQHRHVERKHAFVLERLRHFAIDDALREPFHDGGFAHTRLADQHRVVLGATLKDLDGTADLVIAADDRVELALTRALGEVDGVLLERLALAFGFRRIDGGPATHGFDCRLQRLLGQAVILEQPAGVALVVGEREQKYLAGNELVAALGRDLVGEIEQIGQLARGADFAALAFDLGQTIDGLGERGLEWRDVDAGAGEERSGAAVFLIEQA